MGTFLYIPWFKLEEWNVPLMHASAVVLLLCGLAASKKRWREQAVSTAGFAALGTTVAHFVFEVSEVPVQPFGILVALGVFSASRLAEWQGKNWGVHPAVVADFVTHITVIGLISCYILNGVFYETDTLLEIIRDPSLIFKRWLGLSSFGGFIGGVFALLIWKKRRKMPTLAVADITCWAFPMAWIFGRSGCFVVHDHPGRETTFFLGVEDYYQQEGIIRHDLGFYEVLWSIAVMGLFFYLRKRQDRPTGFFCALLPLLYTPFRFYLDFLRAEDVANPDVRWAGLTPAQYAAIGFFFFSIFFLRWVMRREPPELPDAMRWPPVENEPADDETKRTKKKRKKKS